MFWDFLVTCCKWIHRNCLKYLS